ncbi:MAG: ABC transporter permease [Thermoplasmata archaeon]|nr:ABC transporter permease [Thermoplasmata archaeon]
MSHITSIMKKEIREMLTPGSVASIIVMVVLFAGLGLMINGEVEKASTLPTIGIVADEDSSYYDYEYTDAEGNVHKDSWNPVKYLQYLYSDSADKIVVMSSSTSSSDEEIVAEMEEKGIASVVVFPSASEFMASIEAGESVDVRQLYLYEPTGMFGTVSTSAVSLVLSYANSNLSSILILEGGYTNYEFVTNPVTYSTASTGTYVNGTIQYNISPDSITNAVTSQTMMIPLVIMIIIMMVGSIVISSMGSEKENKTLETLLTLPIKRTTIVAGKIVAAAIVGLVYGLAYMVGMSIYMGSMTSMYTSTGTSVDLASIGMALDLTDWLLVLVSMFFAIVCALGICMILGAFSKNYKSAQTMTMPLSILAMIPMFVIMFSGWYGSGSMLQAVCFIIPFSHPMMAMQALMYGDVTLVLEGIAYMAVFALATILITVKLYNSDILITGLGQNKYYQRLTGRK